MGLFRSGQDFDYDDMEYLADRELVTSFLIYSLVERALGKGFKLKQGEEDHPKNDEVHKTTDLIYDDYLVACSKEQLFGSLTSEMQIEAEKVYLNTFDPRDFTIEFDEFDNITKLSLTEKIKFFDSERTLEKRELTDFGDVLYRYRKGKRERNQGLSYIEPIHDILIGIQNLSESCVYFVIRVGAGLKIIWVSKDNLNNDEYMAELEESIQSMNAENTTMILGMDEDGQKTQLELLSTQPIDFNTLLNFYLVLISLRTEIPVTILQGVTPGQLEGGKINEALLFDVLQKLQKQFVTYLRWIIDWLGAKLEWNLGEYEIDWVTREMIDEVGIQDLLKTKIDNLKELLAIGVQFDKAAEMVRLELTEEEDLDQEKLEEKRLMRENLMNVDNQDTDDEQEPVDPEAEEEDQEST